MLPPIMSTWRVILIHKDVLLYKWRNSAYMCQNAEYTSAKESTFPSYMSKSVQIRIQLYPKGVDGIFHPDMCGAVHNITKYFLYAILVPRPEQGSF
jgi:hypothetical protein